MTPFTIQCTTCRRNLRVIDPEAIGQILSCPKCGSMVLVEPPPGPESAGSSAVVATETSSNPAIPMNAATVTESSQPLKSLGTSSVEDASEAVASSSSSIAKTQISTEVPSMAPSMASTAAIAEMGANEPGPPVVAMAIAVLLSHEEEPAAAANGWPHWFLPGALLTLAAGLLIFAVRMMAPSAGSESASAPNSSNAPVAAAPAERPTESAPAVKSSEEPRQPEMKQEPAAASASRVDEPAQAQASPPENKAQTEIEPQPEIKPQPEMQAAAQAESTRKRTAPPKNPTASETIAPDVEPAASKVPPPPEPTAPAAAMRTKTLQQVAPRPVNVDARLADPLSGIEVRQMPLWAYLDLVSELSSIPITLDAEAVTDLGQSAAVPVRVKLGETTVAGALDAALEPLHLGYDVRDGQLIVGYAPQENMRQVRYAVGDLTDGDDKALTELAALVRRMVAPDSWQQAGGKASIVAGGNALVIQQNDPAHLAVLTFCEKLRVARDRPIKSRFDPARFALTTHLDKAHEVLNKPVTANFGTPQPLSDVVNWLRARIGVTLVVDHAALAAQGLSAESQCTVVADGKPLAGVLDEIVAPLELAWRAIDDKTIEITTPQATAERMDVEFYPVRDLAADNAAGHSLVQRICAKVQSEIWGEDPAKGAIFFDIPGHALMVRAPQKVQAQVEEFLALQRKRK